MNGQTFSMSNYIISGRLPLSVIEDAPPIAPDRYKRFHRHDFSEMVIFLNGSAKHLLEDHSAIIKTGDLLIVPPGFYHTYADNSDMNLINIIYDQSQISMPMLDTCFLPFCTELTERKKRSALEIARPVMNLSDNELKTFKTLIYKLKTELLSYEPGNLFYSLAIFMEIIVFLARLYNAKTNQSAKSSVFNLGSLIKNISNNFNSDIDIPSMAKEYGLSERNFYRRFKEFSGMSPLEFVQQLRVRRASQLLMSSAKTIAEIAFECGFHDSNYFCRVFKKYTSKTPGSFRLGEK